MATFNEAVESLHRVGRRWSHHPRWKVVSTRIRPSYECVDQIVMDVGRNPVPRIVGDTK